MTNSDLVFDSNHFYKPLFDSAAEGILLSNKAGEILLVNPKAESLFGYETGELIGHNINTLIPKEHRKNHEGYIKGYFKKPDARSMGSGMKLFGKCKNGELIPIEIGLNYFDSKGEKYAIALITNISERLKTEEKIKELNETLEQKVKIRTEELKESQKRYQLISRNFPDGTINVLDRNLNYLFVEGKELYKMGVTSDVLMGSNYIERLPKTTAKIVQEKLNSTFKGDSTSIEIHLNNNYYKIDAVPLDVKNAHIETILVIEKNITDKKKIEQEMQQSLEKERELNSLKSRFVSMASHEFRTPLTTILSSNTLLEKYSKTEDQEKRLRHIKKIKTSVHQLNDILNDFLSLDKIEEGIIEVQIDHFNIKEKCLDVIDNLEGVLKNGQSINFTLAGDPIISSDKNIIRIILMNLLSNASKYSHDHQEIDLKINTNENVLEITVTDNGIGIPLEEQTHLFERFYRAKNVTNIEGTGLGLNITQKFISLLSGSISFESIPTSHTTFTVQIPI